MLALQRKPSMHKPAAEAPFSPTVKKGSSTLVVVLSILFYCASTLTLLTFNKWFFTYHRDFGFILTITWAQQIGVVALLFVLQPIMKYVMGDITHGWIILQRVAPVGIFASMDYGFSNLALKIIPMTLYEIVKSCSPAVVLVVSIALGLMRPSWKMTGIVTTIVVGAIIAVAAGHTGGGGASHAPATTTAAPSLPAHVHGNNPTSAAPFAKAVTAAPANHERDAPAFTTQGLILIIVAAIVSATKSVAAQITLHGAGPKKRGSSLRKQPGKPALVASAAAAVNLADVPLNPITTTFYSSLTMCVVLFPAAALMEGRGVIAWHRATPVDSQTNTAALILGSSVLSILVSVSSFLVMKQTSALTYAVVALGERVLIVLCAIIILGESLPLVNACGFGITLAGIGWYNYHKLFEVEEEVAHAAEAPSNFEARRMSHRKFSYSSNPAVVAMEDEVDHDEDIDPDDDDDEDDANDNNSAEGEEMATLKPQTTTGRISETTKLGATGKPSYGAAAA